MTTEIRPKADPLKCSFRSALSFRGEGAVVECSLAEKAGSRWIPPFLAGNFRLQDARESGTYAIGRSNPKQDGDNG